MDNEDNPEMFGLNQYSNLNLYKNESGLLFFYKR